MNKKKILFVILAIILLSASYFVFLQINNKVEVTASEAVKGNMERFIEESGEVLLSQQQIIYAGVTGYIADIFFETGDLLPKGSRILDISSSEVNNNILQRNKIQEEINIAARNLEEDYKLLEKNVTLKEAGALSQKEYDSLYNLIKDSEGRLENLKRDLNHLNSLLAETSTRISSPLEGKLLDKYVKKGDYVHTGTPLLMVGDVGSLYIEADILTRDIKDINEGNKVYIYDNNLGIPEIEGYVSRVYPLAFSKLSDLGVEQNRVKVKIDFPQGDSQLKPGYSMKVKIITEMKEDVLYIPENAVFQINAEDFVFIIKDNKAQLRKIKKGMTSNRNVEIIEGIIEGELVITSPPTDLDEGIRVVLE